MNNDLALKSALELSALLSELTSLQESLHGVITIKLEAMRRSDVEGMIAASHREGELATRAAELDQNRKQIVARLCETLEIAAEPQGRPIRLSAIISRLDPSLRPRIANLAAMLRERMLKVAESNRVVELVSREMLAHFKALFAAMTQDDEAVCTYSAAGNVDRANGPRMLDAVG